jgi:hypothetical protein
MGTPLFKPGCLIYVNLNNRTELSHPLESAATSSHCPAAASRTGVEFDGLNVLLAGRLRCVIVSVSNYGRIG